MKSTNVQATIRELEAERDLILMAIASLKAIDGGKPARMIAQGGPTIVGAAIAHLRKVGTKQTTSQLKEAMIAAGVKATDASIQTILSKRARMKRDLVKKGRAVWGLR